MNESLKEQDSFFGIEILLSFYEKKMIRNGRRNLF
jgi:hypothetical protein